MNGMIMSIIGRGKSMGSFKYRWVSREYILEVMVHRGCLNGMNGMELGMLE
jgi:hypothetical protein